MKQHVVPASIKSTGDATAALNSWITGIPDGASSSALSQLSFNGRTFRVDGTLELKNRKHMLLQSGTFKTDVQGDGHRAHWRAVDSEDIRWKAVKVFGPRPVFSPFNAVLQWQHGFDLQSVNGYVLTNCAVNDVWGDGICHGRSLSPRWTTNGHIKQDCGFHGVGRQAITFTAAKNIRVDACTVTDPTLSIIDIEPNGAGWGADSIIVDGLRVSGTNPAHTYTMLFVQDFGAAGSPVSNITVRNTVQHGNGFVAVVRPPKDIRRSNIVLTGNTTDTPQRGYVQLAGIDGVTLANNQVTDVAVIDCTNVHS